MTIREQQLADLANEATTGYRLGHPTLTAKSTLEDLTAWLQATDPNGCHTQSLFDLEFGDWAPCKSCDGSGFNADPDEANVRDCERCHGAGRVLANNDHGVTHDGLEGAWDALADMVTGVSI